MLGRNPFQSHFIERRQVPGKNEKLDKEMKEQFGGSRLSKFLFFASWFILICFVTSFFWRIEVYDPQSGTIV